MTERVLALAVIDRAFVDAVGRGQDGSGSLDRKQARAFLLDQAGAWAQSRRMWAEIAGTTPEAVRDRALERLGRERGINEKADGRVI